MPVLALAASPKAKISRRRRWMGGSWSRASCPAGLDAAWWKPAMAVPRRNAP